MLFYENLEEIIFHRHQVVPSDELVILSGYLGPAPVRRLASLPFNTTVIYGMYGEAGIKRALHNSLLEINYDVGNTTILYSNTPVHSKCYIWKRDNSIVHALVGSANFSTNGLSTPYREVLAETTFDTFRPLEGYLNIVLNNCISCSDRSVRVGDTAALPTIEQDVNPNICTMTLLDPRTNEVQPASGLNWGHGRGHVTPNDSYIPIRAQHIRNYPDLFPPKRMGPTGGTGGRAQRMNDSIEIIWDDGTVMEGLLEGTNRIDGTIYPKNFASSPHKYIMGEYIRRRIGVPQGSRIYKRDLDRYGRDTIDISLQGEGIYYFDFSV